VLRVPYRTKNLTWYRLLNDVRLDPLFHVFYTFFIIHFHKMMAESGLE